MFSPLSMKRKPTTIICTIPAAVEVDQNPKYQQEYPNQANTNYSVQGGGHGYVEGRAAMVILILPVRLAQKHSNSNRNQVTAEQNLPPQTTWLTLLMLAPRTQQLRLTSPAHLIRA